MTQHRHDFSWPQIDLLTGGFIEHCACGSEREAGSPRWWWRITKPWYRRWLKRLNASHTACEGFVWFRWFRPGCWHQWQPWRKDELNWMPREPRLECSSCRKKW